MQYDDDVIDDDDDVDVIAAKHKKDNLIFMYEDAGKAVSSDLAVK